MCRLYQGDYQQSQVFNDNPAIVAREWVNQGATRLHLVDLDGAKEGKSVNLSTIETILNDIAIPVQVGGGLRDVETVSNLLKIGVEKAILGTVAVEKPELVSELCQSFPANNCRYYARDGKVATRGWLETSEVEAIALGQDMAKRSQHDYLH
jgi:phosphoribosylformimino-5-aminoimidazole carboxamide ribotide isomerase